eukprot:210390-Pelagomonas_calceolata.AAC.7
MCSKSFVQTHAFIQVRARAHTHTHTHTHTSTQFGLPEEFLDPAEVAHALAENEALRADTYLMLDVPPERVLIVDSRCAMCLSKT